MTDAQLTYEGPEQLHANQLFHAILSVTPGIDLTTGASVAIGVKHVSDFGEPQIDLPDAENYIVIETPSQESEWQLRTRPVDSFSSKFGDWTRHPWNQGIHLDLISGSVGSQETVMIYLGGPKESGPGYRCQSFVEHPFRFRLGLDLEGSGSWQTVPVLDSPGVPIIGARPVQIKCIVSDSTGQSTDTLARIKPEDCYGNVAGEAAGDVTLLLDDTAPLARVTLEPERASEIRVTLPRDNKWHYITATSDDGTFYTRSNPIGPSPVQNHSLYFGDIHIMSGHCCGTGNASETYTYAREAAGLDFAAVTSIDTMLTARDWQEIQEATRRAHVPGKFVTYLAYEWGGRSDTGGDHCVYFPGDTGQLVRSHPEGDPAWNDAADLAHVTQTVSDSIDELRGLDVMLVPHCGGRRCNLDFFDPAVMPMLEIYSCHRAFEQAAYEAIRRGIHCGFIADSDDHRGGGGDSHPAARERFFSTHGGLTAVYATELTREAIRKAFFAHHTYATNGPRLVLDVRINDVLMGGELSVRVGANLTMTIYTRLDGFLDKIEVLQGTHIIRELFGEGLQVSEFYETLGLLAEPGEQAYSIRAIQADGGKAWSSPIWVTAE